MKEDVERRDKAQAEVISQQVRLGCASVLVKAESLTNLPGGPSIATCMLSCLYPALIFPPASYPPRPRRPSGWRSWTRCTATRRSCARRSSTRWRT